MINSSDYVKGVTRIHQSNQVGEYKYFLPPSVNTEFLISNKLIEMSEEAMRLVGELNAYSLIVPDVDFFISMHVRKEAVQSSKVEGTRTDIDDAVLEEGDISPEHRDDWREVQNYITALNHSIDRLGDLPLSMRLMNEAHELMLAGTRGDGKTPGHIRTQQNWIGGASLTSAIFIPPHVDQVGNLLKDLELFWHNSTIAMPKLIRVAVSHYQFETIHPYADGNGRIGRLLITLQLMNYGLLSKPTLYLSDFFEKNRNSYYEALTEVRNNQNLDHWLTFFLEGVIMSAKSSKDKFERILELRDSYTERTVTLGRRAKNANLLINYMYTSPVISVPSTASLLELSKSNAGLLINALVECGVLKEITGFSRNRLFILDEYVTIFRS